jgi:hypothetical protein
MTSVFASSAIDGIPSDYSVPSEPVCEASSAPVTAVGQAAHDRLTADQREAAIKLAGDLVVHHMRLANEDGAHYMLHRGNADRAELRQLELIAGRTNPQERTE